ncbi:MAG: elongation factor 4 [Candidatus Omnitrophota bacterium]|nr:MAG: elongation factor 4 [Candidatus Omnitrophota bacterium]
MELTHIRNFCIIAHIDHGKSTLADRMIQYTGAVSKREFRDLLLDDMELEREHGITIKSSAIILKYKAKDGNEYSLNLIDTPGHVDFTYEVSKSIGACEGAILLVDAAQGVEAQTVANLYMAIEHNLAIIPVINKIDLANARIDEARKQIKDILGIKGEEIILASAKHGTNCDKILERIVTKIPAPVGDVNKPLQALVFDSQFDQYKGAIVYIRVVNGKIAPKMNIKFMQTDRTFEVLETGVFRPRMSKVDCLNCGEVGYFTANIRQAKDVVVGDTVTTVTSGYRQPLPGYKKVAPMVYCGIYPVNNKDFPMLRNAVEKLRLSDASFVYEPESTGSIGFGFRCGFLGLLHMQIIQERLEREYDLNLIIATPSVIYQITTADGKTLEIDNPAKFPPPQQIRQIAEPFVRANVFIPKDSLGAIMEFCIQRRGVYVSTEYLTTDRVKLIYDFPLSEIIVDFYDKLKSMTRGYGSLDYEFLEFRPGRLVKLDMLINGQLHEALSSVVHTEKAQVKGRMLVEKFKELIPRQLFEVVVQAVIGSKIIARASIKPLKKHVTGKCYGGDITRKRKLWEKQKMGKKKMKRFGKVQIPQEAFIAALKI